MYRLHLPSLPKAKRILLELDGVATFARLRIDDKVIGEHLGGWTPWRVDITAFDPSKQSLYVDVDERVGHNTQGFLPVFAPHFGGVWKGIRVLGVNDSMIDDLRLFHASVDGKLLHMEIPWESASKKEADVYVRCVGPEVDKTVWSKADQGKTNVASFDFKPKAPKLWSAESPTLYQFEIELRDKANGNVVDRVTIRSGIRTTTADGRILKLNEKPLTVRGVLNWGYAPPRIAPSVDPFHMRKEIEQAKALGFNLMKFCLWVPPQEYLDLCDELGMLAWIEYPTWHPRLDAQHLAELRKEYEEFFHYDRNHPCVVLRSLTCETGHSADIEVIRSLYDRGRKLIPGSLIEDDSSWISWNRVHDFYDDHPYGNNHDWVKTLNGFDQYIQERDAKPLVLGEAIAADTWTNLADLPEYEAWTSNTHDLRSAPKVKSYLEQLESWCGRSAVDRIASDATKNGLAMRKFQIERYRATLPQQGYVVSVLRDFPFASMGLLDFQGRSKWTADQWKWHRDTMVLLDTAEDARSLLSSDSIRLSKVTPDQPQTPVVNGNVNWIRAGSEARQWSLDSHGKVSRPELWSDVPQAVSLSYTPVGSKESMNEWPLWLIPDSSKWDRSIRVGLHGSCSPNDPRIQSLRIVDATESDILIACHFDSELLNFMRNGTKVLMLPDGKPGSFPTQSHWFLRGGIVLGDHAAVPSIMKEMLSDLYLFDLADLVIKQPDYWEEITPLAVLWDNHDLDHFRTHAMVFAAEAGKGRLLVSTLNHDAVKGPAAGYVLHELCKVLCSKNSFRRMDESTLDRMHGDLTTQLQELARKGWKFKADPTNTGLDKRWQTEGIDHSEWNDIEIGMHWDGQGQGAVDGWAWYSKMVDLPAGVRYLTLTGADDYAEVYIDGKLCGSVGDREQKKTAFEMTKSFPIPEGVDGKRVHIAFRVEDWQGAGGIFRPAYVSNQPASNLSPILVRTTK